MLYLVNNRVLLKKEGIMEHFFVKDKRMGTVLVFNNVDLEEAKKMLKHFHCLIILKLNTL